jgi:hypothetical protein
MEINIPCPRRGSGSVGCLQREKISATIMLHSGVPLLREVLPPAFRVTLTEYGFVPVAEVGL